MEHDRPTLPWSLSESRLTFTLGAAGWVVLAWAWWGSSGTGKSTGQTTWLVLGVVALVMIGMGAFFWLHAGRQAVRRRRNDVLDRIELTLPTEAVSEGAIVSAPASILVSTSGGRYHRADCLLVRGKDAHAVGGAGEAVDGLQPCEMCRP